MSSERDRDARNLGNAYGAAVTIAFVLVALLIWGAVRCVADSGHVVHEAPAEARR